MDVAMQHHDVRVEQVDEVKRLVLQQVHQQ
jgi:hypothetical protein